MKDAAARFTISTSRSSRRLSFLSCASSFFSLLVSRISLPCSSVSACASQFRRHDWRNSSVLRHLERSVWPLTSQLTSTTTEFSRMRGRHGDILPGGRGHLRSGVRAAGGSSPDDRPSGKPRQPQAPQPDQADQEHPGPGATEVTEGSGNSGHISYPHLAAPKDHRAPEQLISHGFGRSRHPTTSASSGSNRSARMVMDGADLGTARQHL